MPQSFLLAGMAGTEKTQIDIDLFDGCLYPGLMTKQAAARDTQRPHVHTSALF
jgi:hypothetical protein